MKMLHLRSTILLSGTLLFGLFVTANSGVTSVNAADDPVTSITAPTDSSSSATETPSTDKQLEFTVKTDAAGQATLIDTSTLDKAIDISTDTLAASTYQQLLAQIGALDSVNQLTVISHYENADVTLEQATQQFNAAISHGSEQTPATETTFKQWADGLWTTISAQGYRIDETELQNRLNSPVQVASQTETAVTVKTLEIPFEKISAPVTPLTPPNNYAGTGAPYPVQSTPVPSPVTIPSVTGKTGLPDYMPATAAPKGEVVYAVRGMSLYRSTTFSKANRRASYAKRTRTNRPMFEVLGYAQSNSGLARYRVRNVNHQSRTDGWTGYITTSSKYVVPVYYDTLPVSRTITVINKTGINAYNKVNLTSKAKHYKKGAHLKVTKVVQHNLTTRYVLSNGDYITANKKLIIAGKY